MAKGTLTIKDLEMGTVLCIIGRCGGDGCGSSIIIRILYEEGRRTESVIGYKTMKQELGVM